MPPYTRGEARDWAREKLVGAVNCTIPSFTGDLTRINEKAIRHDVRLAKEHGFVGTLGVSEISITLPEYLEFLRIVKDEAGDEFVVVHHGSWSNLAQNLVAVRGAEQAGAELVLLSYPPNFYPESEQGHLRLHQDRLRRDQPGGHPVPDVPVGVQPSGSSIGHPGPPDPPAAGRLPQHCRHQGRGRIPRHSGLHRVPPPLRRQAVFRMIAATGPITLLWDEVDTVFTEGGGGNEELRGMLNTGYKRTATIPRCVGEAHTVQRFPVFSPAALTGIAGKMPATITTRAITVHMRRKKHTDKAEEFRERIVQREGEPLREALSTWIVGIAETLGEAEPTMPPGVVNRSREIWEPLLAIADAAGDHWPHTARQACAHFVREAEQQPITTGVRLLSDLRTIFGDRDTDRLSTVDILTDLVALDEAPWGDINAGRPLDARHLARELAQYQVTPVAFRIGGQITKGYVSYPTKGTKGQVGLADAWSRYLPTDDETDSGTDDEGESWEH
jgi:hypothetical protein